MEEKNEENLNWKNWKLRVSKRRKVLKKEVKDKTNWVLIAIVNVSPLYKINPCWSR